jgi:hypothetical protein
MKTMKLARPLSLLPMMALAHCAPLTFSNEPAIDYSAYRSVRVDVIATNGHSEYASQYLADQLARTSGFTRVTRDPLAATDLLLEVDLAVSESIDVDVDAEGATEIDIEYEGSALYHAIATDGTLVDSGSREDTSELELEAVEDLLDEIEYHYMAPYRY